MSGAEQLDLFTPGPQPLPPPHEWAMSCATCGAAIGAPCSPVQPGRETWTHACRALDAAGARRG